MARFAALLLATASVAAAMLSTAAAYDPADIVATATGKVGGVHTATARYWRGIPYGGTTGGANRFLPPQPPVPWTGIFNATQWGPGCVQFHHNPDVPSVLSEDCLNVNVYAPIWANATSNLPVMLFFHGGAFAEGSDQGPFGMYDGQYMVSNKPVVIVTGNYRLNAFGWAVTSAANGNMGLLDQRQAMEWVKANIAGFGGDANQVTLWGESAGAMSGGLHLISPGSAGLFNRLIMESNPSGFHYRTVTEMQMYTTLMCQYLKCNTTSGCNLECLQSAPVDAVGDAWSKAGGDIAVILGANWGHWLSAILETVPTVDGVIVPAEPVAALQAGNFNKNVSVLVGTNQDEGATFVYAALDKALPTIAVDAALDLVFGKYASSIATYYKNITQPLFNDGRDELSRIITDWWFRCASEQFATAVTNAGGEAYVYRFQHVFSDSALFVKFGLPAVCMNRTCHAEELPFVFHMSEIHNSQVNVTFTPAEVQLSNSFVDYWTSFGMFGNPNIDNKQSVKWPMWSAARPNIVLSDTISVESSTGLCGFWDTVGYNF